MSGNNENKTNYNDLTKKEQENISAQKAGQLGARIAADAATGGQYEKLRKAPVIGSLAKNAEKRAGKRLAKADKFSGGNIGKVAKPLNESGAIDTVNKGMDVVGGNVSTSNPNNIPESTSNNNKPNGINKKPNFAKNGFKDENKVSNGNSEGANKSRLRDIFNNKKGIKDFFRPKFGSDKKSLFSNKRKNEEKNPGEQVADVAVESTKRLVKKVLLPYAIIISFLLFLFLTTITKEGDKRDAEAGDDKKTSEERTSSVTGQQKKFYERVIEVEEEYAKNGKQISPIYITSTYHIMNRYDDGIKYADFTNDIIKELADGMLGNSTTYSKDTYAQFLKEKFLPKYIDNGDKIDRMVDEIFEYIDEYIEDVYGKNKEKKCTTTTGSSCNYVFDGIHGLNTGKISLSNIQVRLMSSSDCPGGTDNVALDEPLIPFEEYVLGVGYGEIESNYNEEVAKVQLIAARSFAIARPYIFNGAMGVKLIQQNNSNIIQLRSCVADQVFCNPEKGCSVDYDLRYYQPMVYSGSNTHKYTYKQSLNNYPNSKLKSSWMETMGMVAVDKDNKVVSMPYAINYLREDPHDPRVWVKWAQQGMSYKQIIMAAYPAIADIKQANCSDTTESSENAFLTTAHEIWTEITNTFGAYTNGNMVPPTNKTIDCSTYVDWVLYKYGYEDFKGYQKVTKWFVTTDLNAKYGWEEIKIAAGEDATNKLKPGDIIVRDPGNNDGHMAIVSEIRSDGTVWGYDCGDSPHWQLNKGGKPYNFSWFVKRDSRPGKIIRVTNQGTGGTCDTAEAGEWSTWRQGGKAPWKNINLGNSSETIGTAGCYVTSIAIQIARSGVKTNLTNFNPGTLVTELNKNSNSFDTNNGSLTGSGEARISTIVPGFKKSVHYVNLPNDKNKQISQVQEYIDKGYYVVLHLDRGRHWVAVTGTTSDNIQMVDPGRDNTNVYDAYPVSSVVGFSVFEIK